MIARPSAAAVLFLFVAFLSAQENPTLGAVPAETESARISALLPQAQSGDKEALYELAQIYEYPHDNSVYKNSASALEWMLRSAEQGYAPAELGVGIMDLGANGDPGKAEIWLRRAAEQGSDKAQFWLGSAYERGRFGTTDYREAYKWARKSAAQGNPDAEVLLGEMYEDGEFVLQSYATAAKWYRKAAEHVPDMGGAGQGRNDLGLLYLEGKGVPENLALAYMWFSLAQAWENVKDAECEMTRAQIGQAQKMASDWSKQHPKEESERIIVRPSSLP